MKAHYEVTYARPLLVDFVFVKSSNPMDSFAIFLFGMTISMMPAQQTNHNSQGDDAEDDRSRFLINLPLSIKMHTYYGEPQFLNILNSEPVILKSSRTQSEFLFFNASEKTINTIMNPYCPRYIARFCSSFDTQEQLMLVKIPCSSHNAACIGMHYMIKEALIPMGLLDSPQEYPCAIIRSSPVAKRGKQSEYYWGPKSKPPDLPTSPSVTLEVGYSESDSKLTSDARFWLSPGHGCANICLTVLINRSRPEIGIKRWRRASKIRIKYSQNIWITKKGQLVNISEHPLTIPFQSLFRRQSSSPWEGNLDISESRLEKMVRTIWQKQSL